MKKEKKVKFQLEKFNVAKLNDLKSIKGGDVEGTKQTITFTILNTSGSTKNCVADF